MKLEEGTMLGAYSIGELLGSGGMGEVYRATDTRLKRDVAVKVLRERLAEDSDALARFEREAQSIAALSHPNILAVHDVGSDRGSSYVVMELLEGESLRARLQRTNLSTRKAVEIARQIVGGLVAAHDRGIVHRDLKPENVFLTREGLVKILDFGLAKQEPAPFSHDSETAAPTLGHSQPGKVMGTLDYMSPEQVRGQPVDHRTDVFSLGVMLYEILSGQRPHRGESSADIVGAILKEEPRDIAEIDDTIPLVLSRIVHRCLEKNLDDRFQTARDLGFALETVADDSSQGQASYVSIGRPEVKKSSSSVAVIPFTNMSPDPEQEYFCEGMAEEIINSLAGVSGLRVAARSSAFQFNPKSHDAREVGAALNVKTVLEGSVRTAGRRVRVTVQLIDADNGFQLWSDRYDREMDDIFALQDEISEHVVDALKVRLGTEAKEEMKRPTASVEAYQLYLKGLHNWYQRERGSLQKAAGFFEQAVAVDPDYALAHAGLVTSYCSLAFYGMDSSIARARARLAAERAAALAPGVADVHAALGLYAAWLAFDWETAEREFVAAIEANPSYALAYIWYGMLLATLSRHDEAIVLTSRAQEIDPLSPYANTAFGLAQVQAGRRGEAVPALEESINIDADFLYSLWVLGSVYGALGRYEEAVAVLERAVTLSGRGAYYLSWLGWAYGVSGRKPEAEGILDELLAGSSNEDIQPVFLMQVYSGLGDLDSAFEWLEKSVDQGDPAASFIGFPPMDKLREDPRFDGIRESLGIPASS
jgi:serine/threonine protein kinase/tetratricopeptide (TPR) repeat protein